MEWLPRSLTYCLGKQSPRSLCTNDRSLTPSPPESMTAQRFRATPISHKFQFIVLPTKSKTEASDLAHSKYGKRARSKKFFARYRVYVCPVRRVCVAGVAILQCGVPSSRPFVSRIARIGWPGRHGMKFVKLSLVHLDCALRLWSEASSVRQLRVRIHECGARTSTGFIDARIQRYQSSNSAITVWADADR